MHRAWDEISLIELRLADPVKLEKCLKKGIELVSQGRPISLKRFLQDLLMLYYLKAYPNAKDLHICSQAIKCLECFHGYPHRPDELCNSRCDTKCLPWKHED